VSHDRSPFRVVPLLRLLGVAVWAGCLGLDAGPGFQIQQSVVAAGRALPQKASARGNSNSASISGQIVGRLPCDNITGDVHEEGQDLRIVLIMVSGVNGCNGAIPTTFSYVANVFGLKPGPRGIIVEHHFQGTDGQEGVVLDTVVTIG